MMKNHTSTFEGGLGSVICMIGGEDPPLRLSIHFGIPRPHLEEDLENRLEHFLAFLVAEFTFEGPLEAGRCTLAPLFSIIWGDTLLWGLFHCTCGMNNPYFMYFRLIN